MSLLQEYELLRRVPFFAEIEPARLKLLAFMSERVGFDPGKTLCRQGDPADAAFLIIDGEADVILEGKDGPITVATLGPNDTVGEMGILGDVPRNATVKAKTRLVALRIAKDPFMRMVREFPTMAVSIMRELAHRLDMNNHLLRDALSEVRRLREGEPPSDVQSGTGGVSRLDSFHRRIAAQRACLGRAAELIRDLDGVVLEMGLGNGRTYDLLRKLFPDRDIYVAERKVGAHPDCIPPDDRLILGDMRETLPAARSWLEGRVALGNLDVGTGVIADNRLLATMLAPHVVPLLKIGAILASDLSIELPELEPLPLPDSVPAGRYHLYRRI
jgi:CRP-like cAMP-binding protein